MKQSQAFLGFFLSISCCSMVWAVPTDYLVLRWSATEGLVSDYHQVVDLPANKFIQASQASDQVVTLSDGLGKTVGHVSLKHAMYTRSEHHGHDHIDGGHLVNDEVVFVIRAEQGLVKSIQLPFNSDQTMRTYNWQTLLETAAQSGPQQVSKNQRGAVNNRVNLLFMGDGYTAAQQAQFNQNVDAVISYMQTFEPYLSYANFVAYDRLFTASNQSGGDKPAPCFNPASSVDTAFDATYCTSNIRRLLTVNASKVFTAAAASPDWDEITVIVNDHEYGGAGGSYSTISTNAAATDVFIHEYGHSFTNLADEYDSAFPGFPACSDTNGPACEANATDVSVRNNIKWNYFIAAATPVPTPETSQYNGVMGLFEGARYLTTGMYRPYNFCNMRTLGSEFCSVCQEAYVLRVYEVAYAAGNSKLSLIEPGTGIPSDLTPDGMVSVPMHFAIDTLQPSHDLNVTWLVNDVVQSNNPSSQVTQSYSFTPTQAGMTSVKVRVKDNSPLVHSSRLNELPTFELEWTVDVQPLVDLIFADDFE